tara:strand:+ start:1248 stop:1715 length:468 start_codon:yes stop_codon:yes gene_type:complete
MKYYFIILFISTLFPFIVIAPDNPSKSDFRGTYVTLGIQFGKDNNKVRFHSYQININTAIESPLMAGITYGKRYYKDNRSYSYFDIQTNIIFFLGAGIGAMKENKEIYFRKKIFGGVGPIMYSKDWTNYNDKLNKNSGIMISAPLLIVFGNKFHP